MEQQIKEQFHKAFYEVIRESVLTSNHEHIVRLYAEIVDRIAAKVKKDGPTFKKIHQDFDVDFFKQLLTNKVFDSNSLIGLVNTTFRWIHDLQMPIRDTSTEEARQRVLQTHSSMADIVPMYIKEVHGCLDLLEKDMDEFFENQNHPVVQQMLKQAIAHKK
jgi:hypothetical protein